MLLWMKYQVKWNQWLLILVIKWIICIRRYSFLICLFISVVNQFICLLVLKELFDYSLSNYCLKVVLPCLLVSIFAYPLSYLAHSLIEDSLIRLFIVFWVNIFVTVIAIYIFGLTNSERNTLVFIVKKMKKK